MIVIKCAYCEAFIEDPFGENFRGRESFDIVKCRGCGKINCLNLLDSPEHGSGDDVYSGEWYNFSSSKAPCLNGETENHHFKDGYCLICRQDLTPICMKEGNTHKFDDVSHACVYCNNALDPLFVPCKNGGKMHLFVNGQCHCLKLENCTDKDILDAQEKSLSLKKAIGTLGQMLDYRTDEYKSSTSALFGQLAKIDKFLEANR